MNNRLTIFVILIMMQVSTHAQVSGNDKQLITSFGNDVGFKTERTISSEGGRIDSYDGKLELIVPEGALKKTTNISIQAVKNKLPLGLGDAYKLEPSGIEFKKPVQLIFHYTEEEAEEDMQSLLGIAMQDENGKWFELFNTNIDNKTKTISGQITHFSVWSKFMDLKIYPQSAKLKVGADWRLALEIFMKKQSEPNAENDQSTTALIEILLDPSFSTANNRNTIFNSGQTSNADPAKSFMDKWNAVWTVNGITNGNSIYGQISPKSSIEAVYKTPGEVPDDNNPVTITVKLNGFSYKKKGKTLNNPGLKSKILLFDNAYELKVELESKDVTITRGSTLGSAIYKDKSKMIFEIKRNSLKIKEIINYDDYWYYEWSKCRQTVIKRGTGMVHIGGLNVAKVVRNFVSESAPPLVELDFTYVNAVMSSVQIECPKASLLGGGFQLGNRAFPMYLKFTVSEGRQVLQREGSRGGESFLEISVRKMTEEDNSFQ